MLHVDNLSVQILKQVSFTLESGQNLTILGDNGSGKTTLAKALTHLIPNDRITLEGKNITALSPKERSEWINFIPARLHIYDEFLSVSDYLALNCLRGETSGDIHAVLEELGITHLQESRCQNLSSGESALLLIGGAMLHRARYTILDEPTANLDQSKKVQVYRLLKNSPRFHTRIVITHDLNLAYKLNYPVLYLVRGEVHFFGSCDDFFAPEHLQGCFGSAVTKIGENFVVNYDENL